VELLSGPGAIATSDAACDKPVEDDRISWSEPLDGPGPPGPPDTGTPVSATVGVTAGTFPLPSTVPESSESLTAGGGEADGMGAGSLFNTAGLKPGVVELAAKGELTEADRACKEEGGGLLAEPNSPVGTGTGI
jgi:hypothetical protein